MGLPWWGNPVSDELTNGILWIMLLIPEMKITDMQKYFPLDVATNEAFFNRTKERKRLINNINSNTHTLVTSPRRYGKTSLVLNVLTGLDIQFKRIELTLATNEFMAKNIILNGIGDLLGRLSRGNKGFLKKIRTIFAFFAPVIESVDVKGVMIKFRHTAADEPHISIIKALENLDQFLSVIDEKVAIFFDEFQQIASLNNAADIEAALRAFAQTSKRVNFIFSGSNRHLLDEIFSDRNRPFFNMCDHILLDRISEVDYLDHLSSLAIIKWKPKTDIEDLKRILFLTKRHPYYVNALCRRLWSERVTPNKEKIQDAWDEYVGERHKQMEA